MVKTRPFTSDFEMNITYQLLRMIKGEVHAFSIHSQNDRLNNINTYMGKKKEYSKKVSDTTEVAKYI